MKRPGDPVALGVLLGVALLWYGGLALSGGSDPALAAEERQAARTMAEAIRVISQEAARRGFPPDPATDPNGTGLIGLPFSPITTTLGSLPAKRTGAQPDAAALMVRLLRQAGVQAGDRVGVDSSGSFPGFAIATLAAVKTLGAEAVTLVSIGSSTYGANRPQFTLADMLTLLVRQGVLSQGPAAVSPGGESDLGRNMEAEALEAALARAGRTRTGVIPIIRTPDRATSLALKRAILGTPRVLVSIGGNWTSAGPWLPDRTGLLLPDERDSIPGTGLIQSHLRDGIPVIRILDIQDLCARTGLAYDPIPWGRSEFLRPPPHRALAAAGPPLAFLAAFLVRRRRERRAAGNLPA